MSLLIDLLFPRRCSGCGSAGQYLCSHCLSTLRTNSFSPAIDSLLEGHLSLWPYDLYIRDLILAIKYQYLTNSVAQLASLAVDTIISKFPNLLKHWQTNHYTIVPIPLHPLRQNWRGFNQTFLLAEPIARHLSLNYFPDLLYRAKFTSPQAREVHRQNRYHNLSSAFKLNPSHLLTIPQNIILFDDVYTTGATLESVALTLKQFKNTSIVGLTLAG